MVLNPWLNNQKSQEKPCAKGMRHFIGVQTNSQPISD
jgi:hypothetical protein